MPASNQIPTPVMPGVDVTPSQINTNGPFSAQLAKPAFDPGPITTTGRGGPGEALLAFANNFLAGASQGRLRQFQQSEIAKKQHETNYDATVQHIMDSPDYTRDFKEQVYQQALAQKASAGLSALGGGKGSKKDHPLIGLARSVFSSAVGPSENADHVDIGPEHVSDLITQMNQPQNRFNAAEAIGGTQQKLNDIINTVKTQTAATNSMLPKGTEPIALTRDVVENHPDVIAEFTKLRRQGIEPTQLPAVQQSLDQVPPRLTAPQQLAMAKDRAELTHFLQQGHHWDTQSQRLMNMPVSWTWKDSTGQQQTGSVKFNEHGDMLDLSGNPIPNDDPRKTTGMAPGTGISWSTSDRFIAGVDDQGNPITQRVPVTTYHGKGTPPPPGTLNPGAAAPTAPTASTPSPLGMVTIPEVAPGQPGVQQLAFKNNNPGNLMFNHQPGAVLGEGGFAKFETPEAGYAAIAPNIDANKNGPLTLAGYIGKYAPPSKNDTATYIKNASSALGVSPETPLAQIDTQKLAQFQAKQESGTQISAAPGTAPGTPAPPAGQQNTFKRPATAAQKKADIAAEMARPLTPEEQTQLRTRRASDISLDKDAWDYMLNNGKLNVRGMGDAVQPQIKMIKATASQIAKDMGLNVGDIMARGAQLRGNTGAYVKLTSQTAAIKAFEDTLLKNTEIAKQLSANYPRYNLQFANKVLDAFKTGKGDPEALNLAGQLHGVATEWAKIMAGATSSIGVPLSSAKQAEEIISKYMSDGQLNSLVDNVIKPDAAARSAALEGQQQALLGQIRGVTGPQGGPPPPKKTASPNPNVYIQGHRYGGMVYNGPTGTNPTDINNTSNWTK